MKRRDRVVEHTATLDSPKAGTNAGVTVALMRSDRKESGENHKVVTSDSEDSPAGELLLIRAIKE